MLTGLDSFVGAILAATVFSACIHHPKDAPTPQDEPALAGGADLHVHVTMRQSLPLFGGGVDGRTLATSPDQWLTNQLTTPGIRRAGLRVIVATLWPSFDLRPDRDALGEALAQMDELKRFVATHPGYAIAKSAEDARRLMGRDLVVLIPHLEGAEAIRDVGDVDRLYAAGFRSIGLVHFTDNAIAGAHDDQFGPVPGVVLNGSDEGLSALGRDAVKRMFALGILVDLAHCHARTRDDVLALAEAAKIPVIDSHAGPDWTSPRTISDEHAKRIAALGGLIGVGIYRHDALMSAPAEQRWDGFVPTTCDDTVAIWMHLASIVGPEHLMLGSDLNSTVHRPRPGGLCPNGLRHVGDLPELYSALEKRGYPRARLEDAADRLLQVFDRASR